MARTKKLDSEDKEALLLDLLERGGSPPEIAQALDVSTPTVKEKIAELQNKQGLLLQYRNIQSLQLTELQYQILAAVTPDKIQEASLKDLMSAFKVLKGSEHLIEGKPTEIKGLVAYLVDIEKEEIGLSTPVYYDSLASVDVTVIDNEEEEPLPRL